DDCVTLARVDSSALRIACRPHLYVPAGAQPRARVYLPGMASVVRGGAVEVHDLIHSAVPGYEVVVQAGEPAQGRVDTLLVRRQERQNYGVHPTTPSLRQMPESESAAETSPESSAQ